MRQAPIPPEIGDIKHGEHWVGTDGKTHFIVKTGDGKVTIYQGEGSDRKTVQVDPSFFSKKADPKHPPADEF